MSENLEAQLDEVTNYVNGYWDFQKTVMRSKPPVQIYRAALQMQKLRRAHPHRRDVLSGRIAPWLKPVLETLATDEEKETEHYKIYLEEYPLNAISNNLIRQFPAFNFDKLKKLHVSRKEVKLSFEPKQKFGLGLAAVALTLKTVPKKAIEDYTPYTYDDFELFLFTLNLIILAILLLIFVPEWFSYRRNKKRHDFIAEVLEYTSLKVKFDEKS